MARIAGLRLRERWGGWRRQPFERWGGWRGQPFTRDSTLHISMGEDDLTERCHRVPPDSAAPRLELDQQAPAHSTYHAHRHSPVRPRRASRCDAGDSIESGDPEEIIRWVDESEDG
jgi:hypothetical protein